MPQKDPEAERRYSDLRAAVNDWPMETCRDCGHEFPKEKSFATRCPICFKVQSDFAVLQGDRAFFWMQLRYSEAVDKNKELMSAASKLLATVRSQEAELIELRKKANNASVSLEDSGLDLRTVRDMLILCHPDRHDSANESGQSHADKANETTKKLLALRDKLRSANGKS